MNVKLFKLVRKGQGDAVILRHMGTTNTDDGQELQWFSLADDPSGVKWPMTRQQVQQHDWERLRYIRSRPNAAGELKHWFESSA